MNYQFNYFLNKLPIIGIDVSYRNKTTYLSALIDTGADYTLLSKGVAERLGLKIEEGKLKILEGAGGNIVAYMHRVHIKICGKEIPINACFSERDVPENILGRKDIINNFKLVLDKNHFELIEHENENQKS